MLWARDSIQNYRWTVRLGLALANEYRLRYGAEKVHKSQKVIEWAAKNEPSLPDIGLTPMRLAMPDEYKVGQSTFEEVIASYRIYYIRDKAKFAKWTNRSPPDWFTEGVSKLTPEDQAESARIAEKAKKGKKSGSNAHESSATILAAVAASLSSASSSSLASASSSQDLDMMLDSAASSSAFASPREYSINDLSAISNGKNPACAPASSSSSLFFQDSDYIFRLLSRPITSSELHSILQSSSASSSSSMFSQPSSPPPEADISPFFPSSSFSTSSLSSSLSSFLASQSSLSSSASLSLSSAPASAPPMLHATIGSPSTGILRSGSAFHGNRSARSKAPLEVQFSAAEPDANGNAMQLSSPPFSSPAYSPLCPSSPGNLFSSSSVYSVPIIHPAPGLTLGAASLSSSPPFLSASLAPSLTTRSMARKMSVPPPSSSYAASSASSSSAFPSAASADNHPYRRSTRSNPFSSVPPSAPVPSSSSASSSSMPMSSFFGSSSSSAPPPSIPSLSAAAAAAAAASSSSSSSSHHPHMLSWGSAPSDGDISEVEPSKGRRDIRLRRKRTKRRLLASSLSSSSAAAASAAAGSSSSASQAHDSNHRRQKTVSWPSPSGGPVAFVLGPSPNKSPPNRRTAAQRRAATQRRSSRLAAKNLIAHNNQHGGAPSSNGHLSDDATSMSGVDSDAGSVSTRTRSHSREPERHHKQSSRSRSNSRNGRKSGSEAGNESENLGFAKRRKVTGPASAATRRHRAQQQQQQSQQKHEQQLQRMSLRSATPSILRPSSPVPPMSVIGHGISISSASIHDLQHHFEASMDMAGSHAASSSSSHRELRRRAGSGTVPPPPPSSMASSPMPVHGSMGLQGPLQLPAPVATRSSRRAEPSLPVTVPSSSSSSSSLIAAPIPMSYDSSGSLMDHSRRKRKRELDSQVAASSSAEALVASRLGKLQIGSSPPPAISAPIATSPRLPISSSLSSNSPPSASSAFRLRARRNSEVGKP